MDYIGEFNSDTHTYYIDGQQVRSVTQILRQAGLSGGFGPAHYAKLRGNAVHAVCEADDAARQDLRRVPREWRAYLSAWRDYRAIAGFEPTESERKVFCLDPLYAGTLDRVGTRRGSQWPIVLDIKTAYTGSPADHVKYQTVAYAHAYRPGQLFERIAVTLRPDGTFGVRVWGVDTFTQDLARWLQIVKDTKDLPVDA